MFFCNQKNQKFRGSDSPAPRVFGTFCSKKYNKVSLKSEGMGVDVCVKTHFVFKSIKKYCFSA